MEEKNVWMREFERHKEVWNASADAWKGTLEEMKLQFSLGKKEAIDEFEEQKDKFKDFVDEIRTKVDGEKDMAEEFLTEIRGEIDELNVQLALGKADTKDLYEERKKAMLATIEKLKAALEKAYGKVDEDWNARIEQFKAKLESLRVQFELGKYETRDELSDKKSELDKMVNDFKSQLDTAEQTGKEKLETFSEEMTKSFEHLKNAFKDMF